MHILRTLSTHRTQLDEHAHILNNINPGGRKGLRHRIVSNSKLHPHQFRLDGEDVVQMLRNICRATKELHNVDSDRHIRELAIRRLAEEREHLWVVDRHRDNPKASPLRVLGHIEGGGAGIGGFDPENGNCRQSAKGLASGAVLCEEMALPWRVVRNWHGIGRIAVGWNTERGQIR